MNFKFKNKKIIIFAAIIILILVAGGVFWWQEMRKPTEKGETFYEVKLAKNYEVKETAEGKIVENKEEGFVAKVPEGWIVKEYGIEIALFSPEVEFDERGSFILERAKEKGGCGTSIQIIKYKKVDPGIETDAEILRRLIIEAKENPIETETKKQEVVMIDNKSALKKITLQEGEIKYILAEVPVDNTVYSFSGAAIFAEKCIQEFDRFLESVEINK